MVRVPTSPTASLESSTVPSPLPHPVPKVSTGQSYSTCPKHPNSPFTFGTLGGARHGSVSLKVVECCVFQACKGSSGA